MIAVGDDGVAGETTTGFVAAPDVPHEFPAVTVMFPFCPADPAVTVIDVVPAPEVIVHPVGTVHVYVVALVTAAIEYVWLVTPGHCACNPVIAPGTNGVPFVTVTANVEAADVPQGVPAVTVMFPF
jgi:hypothetical protein